VEKLFLGKTMPDSGIQIYVNSENAELGICWAVQCEKFNEESEIWSVHSSHNGGFLKMCAFHLLAQLDHGFVTCTAEGELETLNWAQASFDDIHYEANLNLFCKKCNCVRLFTGPATRFPFYRKTFRGLCTYCGEIISGRAVELYEEKRLMVRKIKQENAREKEQADAEAESQPLEYIWINSAMVVYDPNKKSFTLPVDTKKP